MGSLRVAVIGHVDHGKSSLLGRLLFDSGQVNSEKIKEIGKNFAFFLDNLEEERVEGMTIDVFYARYQSPGYQYTFIDTPGHKEFIKNMLSGASRAEAAVLLVSATPKEGIQEQTKMHLQLTKLLGINQIAVVINKMDLVEYKKEVFEKIKNEVSLLLKKIGFKINEAPFIPVSAIEGVNVYQKSEKTPWYQGKSFIGELDDYFRPSPSLSVLPLRLVIQDVYSFSDGKVIAGKVETGVLTKGSEVIFKPSGVKSKIKEIRMGEKEKEKTEAGEVIGVVLENKEEKIGRGEVGGTEESLPSVCQEFLAQIYLLEKGRVCLLYTSPSPRD